MHLELLHFQASGGRQARARFSGLDFLQASRFTAGSRETRPGFGLARSRASVTSARSSRSWVKRRPCRTKNINAQPPDSGEPVTLKEKNPMPLNLNHLHPSTPAKRPEKAGPSCYNANRKLSGKKHLGGGTKISAIPPQRAGNNEGGR